MSEPVGSVMNDCLGTMSDPSEYLHTNNYSFLGKWHFSTDLQERLKKFPCFVLNDDVELECTTALGENVPVLSINSEELEERTINSCGISNFKDVESHVSIDGMDVESNSIDNYSSQVLLETLPKTNILDKLQEGPINDDELSLITCDSIFQSISKVSDSIILNLSESVCSSLRHQTRLVPILCERFLLPKICDQACDKIPRTVLSAVRRIFEGFPQVACNYLLIPVIHEPKFLLKLDPVFCDLSIQTKQIVMKFFLESGVNVVEEHHISLLLSLLTSSQDANTNIILIDMLSISGSNLTKSTKFGKLLVCVTKSIGPLLLAPARLKLLNIIESHKSFQKKLAQQAFESLEDEDL